MRKAEVVQGKYKFVKKDMQEISFPEFSDDYLKNHAIPTKRPSSVKRDKVLVLNLKKFFGNMKLSKITREHIDQYIAERKQETTRKKELVRPATVNREVALLKNMFTKAIDWGKVTENPVKGLKMLHEPDPIEVMRVLSWNEETKLMESATPHLRPILVVALNTGMRLGEILNLKWEDINFAKAEITVKHTKTKKARRIPINNCLILTLRKLTITDGYVFCHEDGKPYGSIKTSFYKAVRKAGIGHLRFHDLRHTFATRLAEVTTLPSVQAILGHQDIKTTMRYAHATKDQMLQGVQLLEIGRLRHNSGTIEEKGDFQEKEVAGVIDDKK